MSSTTAPVVHRDQWDRNPSLAANYAAHSILDAASRETSVTLAGAQRAIADVIGYALSNPDRYVQDNAMNHFVIPTIRSNQSLITFAARVDDAWRDYTVARNMATSPIAITEFGFSKTTLEAALAGARNTFDKTVASLVEEYVGHLANQPPRNPAIDRFCAAAGERAVASVREWQTDEGLRLAGLPPRAKG